MRQEKHTPLPYKKGEKIGSATEGPYFVSYDEKHIIPFESVEYKGIKVIGCLESYQVIVAEFPDNNPDSLANAEFIVRACNSHYELLEALKELVEFKHFPMSKNPQYGMALEIGKAAIAKAEAKQ